MYKLTIKPTDTVVEIDDKTSIREALAAAGMHLNSPCGGVCSCGQCVVKILFGEDNLKSPGFEELSLLGNVFHITKERLACQTYVEGDVIIDISAHLDAIEENRGMQISRPKKAVTVKRSREEYDEILAERKERSEQRKQEVPDWEKHWEKDKDPMSYKKLGGKKRPKPFNTDKIDYDSRPSDKKPEESAPKRDFIKSDKDAPKRDYKKSDDRGPKKDFRKSDGKGPKKDFKKSEGKGPRKEFKKAPKREFRKK